VAAAQIQCWLSVAQGPLINGPARARLFNVFNTPVDHAQAKDLAEKLFSTLEQALGGVSFLVGPRVTIADVAPYTYTAHSPEGGVSLEPYVPRWRSS
jgi:glutathione S-transferase